MDSGAVQTEAGGGMKASRYCHLRLVELEMPGESTCLSFPVGQSLGLDLCAYGRTVNAAPIPLSLEA